MALTPSTMLALGSKAPDFRLPDTDGTMVALDDFKDAPAYLIMFICNHCPYVKHVRPELATLTREYRDEGVAVVGITANDVTTHPDDSPEQMAREKAEAGYTFPYLYDETQEVAKAYQAACTPDFFVFDRDRDWSTAARWTTAGPATASPSPARTSAPRSTPSLPAGRSIRTRSPSIGCNIKWKPGNEPSYVG